MGTGSSGRDNITRRNAVKLVSGTLLSGVASSHLGWSQAGHPAMQNTPQNPQSNTAIKPEPTAVQPASSRLLTDEDLDFLEEMEKCACLFFMEQAHPDTGQVLDRATNKDNSGKFQDRFVASIASTGFGLTALCIADSRKYAPTDRLKKQVITTLQFHLDKMPNEHGFFYHFNDAKTGQPLINSEVSPIDTSILICGILTARAYFDDPKITSLATQIYNRVDWPWMLNGGKTFALGWRPATGFIASRWDHYAEMMMMYLL